MSRGPMSRAVRAWGDAMVAPGAGGHDVAAAIPDVQMEAPMRPWRGVPLLAAAVLALGAAAVPAGAEAAAGTAGHCARLARVTVPGAEHQQKACLPDMTTTALAGTTYTDTADQAGLAAAGTTRPSGVPGVQVDGYFPDTSGFNTTHGWQHDAQFVLRLPDRWNGGLIVTGAPGTRKQYSLDVLISDWAIAQGYAFASTDKGNSGPDFYTDGRRPGDAMAEWNRRTTQLTVAAKAAVASATAARRTVRT